MNLIIKVMNFALQTMNVVFKMMKSSLKSGKRRLTAHGAR